MSLFILISKDNWLDIMYSGIDAVGVDKQPIKNYNEWMIIYFITFLLFGGFFMFNTFVGVIIENFIKCRALQKIEENERNFAKRFRKFKRARIGNFYFSFLKINALIHFLARQSAGELNDPLTGSICNYICIF